MKEKILETARELYNQHGMAKVTARFICEALGISPGSFSYHFRDKKKIVEGLYERMLGEMQQVYASIQQETPSILVYLRTHQAVFGIQQRYRFFYLNLFEILSQHESIREQYTQLQQMERQMALQSFQQYVAHGVLKNDISEAQIQRMINVGQILNNFWMVDAAFFDKGTPKMAHYMKICCGLLEPHLTPRAAEEYEQFFEALEEADEKG